MYRISAWDSGGEGIIDRLSRCFLQTGKQVAVHVKGDRHVAVSETFAHNLGMDALREHQSGVCVAQSMKC